MDLSPLVDFVDRLTRRNAELTEAATIWQVRAINLEEQPKQLTAGPIESACGSVGRAVETAQTPRSERVE